MASRAQSPGNGDESPGHSGDDSDSTIPDNASKNFTIPETNYALDFLLKDPTKYLSGNGFKDIACTAISQALKKKFPNRPFRKINVVGNRLRYVCTCAPYLPAEADFLQVKSAYEDYEFVRGKSGVGWDDEIKMATAETEFVDNFVEVRATILFSHLDRAHWA